MPGWRLRERCNSRLHEPAKLARQLCPAACMPGPGRWTAWGGRAQGPLPRAGPRGSGWGRAETLCHQSVHGCGGKWGSVLTGASREPGWQRTSVTGHQHQAGGNTKSRAGGSPWPFIVCRGARGQWPSGLGQPRAGQGGHGVAVASMATEQLSFWETLRWAGGGGHWGGAGALPGSSAEWQFGEEMTRGRTEGRHLAWPLPPPGRTESLSAQRTAWRPAHPASG